MTGSLGFSVSCYHGDIPLLRGCLESIRTFAPDAPICLFPDGDLNLDRIVRSFNVTCIPRSAVRHPVLRERSYGYGITKMVALWEAPFERIIHVDADAVLWGDIRSNLPATDWDFVYNEPHELITDQILRQQYFDPELVGSLISDFQWRDQPYFNSGVFACRVGALPLRRYLDCLDVMERNHQSIFQDQGLLALMVFRAAQQGLLRVEQADLQTIVPVLSPDVLRRRFTFREGQPVLLDRSTVIHWAGPKPYLDRPHPFSEPMHVFRARGLQRCGVPRWFPASLAMRIDEWRYRTIPQAKLRLKAFLKQRLRRFNRLNA